MVFVVTLILLINPFAAVLSLVLVGVVDCLLFGMMWSWNLGINCLCSLHFPHSANLWEFPKPYTKMMKVSQTHCPPMSQRSPWCC